MNDIKVYEEIYIVELRNGKTYELPAETAGSMKLDRARKNKQCVLLLGNDAVDGFEVKAFFLKEVASEVDAYILAQPKHIRDKLNAYIKDKPGRNNIAHVSNVIEGINAGKV